MKNINELIQLAYLHAENNNQEAIDKVNKEIQNLLKENTLITVKESEKIVKIPYGNDGEFIVPVFTDKIELKKGLEYFKLNDMEKDKIPETVKIDEFEKIKENPNFLGLLINIATVSYIVNLNF